QVVDVAVRVVAGDAASEPEDLPDAEVAAEDVLELGAREPWVSRLDRAQQALLGREERAAAVHVDAAALEHHLELPLAAAEQPGEAVRRRIVAAPVRILRPRVEPPVGERDLAVAPDEERTEVSGPGAVGRDAVEVDLRRVDARALEHAPRRPLRARVAHE